MSWLGHTYDAVERRLAKRRYVRGFVWDMKYGSALENHPYVSRLTLFVEVNYCLPTKWELQ